MIIASQACLFSCDNKVVIHSSVSGDGLKDKGLHYLRQKELGFFVNKDKLFCHCRGKATSCSCVFSEVYSVENCSKIADLGCTK